MQQPQRPAPTLAHIRETLLGRNEEPSIGPSEHVRLPSGFKDHIQLVPEADITPVRYQELRTLVNHALESDDQLVVWTPRLPHDIPLLPPNLGWGCTLTFYETSLVGYQLVAYVQAKVRRRFVTPGGCFALVPIDYVGGWNGEPVNAVRKPWH